MPYHRSPEEKKLHQINKAAATKPGSGLISMNTYKRTEKQPDMTGLLRCPHCELLCQVGAYSHIGRKPWFGLTAHDVLDHMQIPYDPTNPKG